MTAVVSTPKARFRLRPLEFRRIVARSLAAAAALLLTATAADAHSLRFLESRPTHFDFVDIPRLPPEFGRGEFSLELWIKPDNSYPVGDVWAPSFDQLRNWSNEDPRPYSSGGWWITGNWLLDGHTRPRGFNNGDTREGTLSLNFYGGGRLRFMFADKTEGMPVGGVYAVQAWPATETPSLLDGRWHHVVALRRWREPTGAILELWIDGARIASTDIPDRTDMRRFWDDLAHPEDPPQLGGWSLGAEVMTAWRYAVTQFEDYKGLVDDLRFWSRALAPAEIERLARGRRPAPDEAGLSAWFPFDEGGGRTTAARNDRSYRLTLHRTTSRNWAQENAPAAR